MADGESDLETDGLESDLDTLFVRHCRDDSSPKNKEYCSEFCKLVEEYTGRWQVPLPQLKVLRTALCCFTNATVAFPDDCNHICYALSSLALSFFELMLFFGKEEFQEDPLKDIMDSFQECNLRLLRHRNMYMQHVKQVIKVGGPWESPVLQNILRGEAVHHTEVEEYLSSEVPLFLELRLRYLQACERVQEATALAKSCLEHRDVGRHLYFHQAYLTCLYKASLHEHLHKEMAELDGRDAVEIICNTECVEKDELLLSLCKAFLCQQLRNGDMYYIWDLVFIWSRLHLRAHQSRNGFLAECRQLAYSATNVKAIFPFIKVVTVELGNEGVQFCVELCARTLQLCDPECDLVTRSLVCKTLAFLLPCDLEVCRACALQVFFCERSPEAYRTVCLLYMQPDQEPHPHGTPLRTDVRFHILQILKKGLYFDPEFWNLLTLRTHCLELISDNAIKAAMLSEMEEEEYLVDDESNYQANDVCSLYSNTQQTWSDAVPEVYGPEHVEEKDIEVVAKLSQNTTIKRRKWTRRRKTFRSDEEPNHKDDPEFKYNLKPIYVDKNAKYSLRRSFSGSEKSAPLKPSLDRQREYLSRRVKNKIRKRKGRKKQWLQGLYCMEQAQVVQGAQTGIKIKGKKRGRKPLQKLELSYPENEVILEEMKRDTEDTNKDDLCKEHEHLLKNELEEHRLENHAGMVDKNIGESLQVEGRIGVDSKPSNDNTNEPQDSTPASEAAPELDGPLLELFDCPVQFFHNYSLDSKESDTEQPLETMPVGPQNDNSVEEPGPLVDMLHGPSTQGKGNASWKDKMLRSQRYSHLTHHCTFCQKDFKGLNVLRHVLSHLKKKKRPRCIFCGKRFKQPSFAKTHVLQHIEEMCKNKKSIEKVRIIKTKKKVEETPVINRVTTPSEKQTTIDEKLPSDSVKEQNSTEKPKGRTKPAKLPMPTLSREARIIRNLRMLIKKTSSLPKKHKTPASQLLEFKDEQVLIEEDLVILKHVPLTEGDKVGENGCETGSTFYLCPSENCDKVFLRMSNTLTKHAINFHIKEEKVLEKTYLLTKRKCILCSRQMLFLQHFKDHMGLHDAPLRYFCYHGECSQRFSSQQELKDHIQTHKPYRPQCTYTDCKQLFSNTQALYDHEWRHYTQAPLKEDLELTVSRQKQQTSEAPWKQRVKIEEIWLHCGKGQEGLKVNQLGLSKITDPTKSNGGEACNEGMLVSNTSDQDIPKSDCALEQRVSSEVRNFNQTLVNGHEEHQVSSGDNCTFSTSHTSAQNLTPQLTQEGRHLNIKEADNTLTLREDIKQKIEPHITEHKTFKPEDTSYMPFNNAPFIRPPPSSYLDESVLSMRKRRATDESDSPPKNKLISWKSKKKEAPASEPKKMTEVEVPEVKTRHRCNKCLSSFSSPEDLKKHQALNTCSALFGFDSDDDS